MDVNSFYGFKKSRVTTVAEALDHIDEVYEIRSIRNVVVFPREAGDRGDQESDLEDAMDDGEED